MCFRVCFYLTALPLVTSILGAPCYGLQRACEQRQHICSKKCLAFSMQALTGCPSDGLALGGYGCGDLGYARSLSLCASHLYALAPRCQPVLALDTTLALGGKEGLTARTLGNELYKILA